MRYPQRFLMTVFAFCLYCSLLAIDGRLFFPAQVAGASFFVALARFGFSSLVALLFLAVGSLAWFYARQRLVGWLFFGFCLAMMATFAVQTVAAPDVTNSLPLSVISHMGSALALALFSALLLVFPHHYFTREHDPKTRLLLRGYLVIVLCLCLLVCGYALVSYKLPGFLPSWLHMLQYGYYLLALVGILITLIVSSRRTVSLRERQQLRIVVYGVILAFGPLLVLTMVPLTLHLPQLAVDGQLSTLFLGLFPLALGYSILRYHILVLDRSIRRVVRWIVGGISLAVLGYLVFASSSVLFPTATSISVMSIIVVLVGLAPLTWWVAGIMTDTLFFREMAHYRHLVEQPDLLTREIFALKRAAGLITTAASSAFETHEVCLFVLDEDTGYYQAYPRLRSGEMPDVYCQCLVEIMRAVIHQPSFPDSLESNDAWLASEGPVMQCILSATRPLFLSQATRGEDEPIGFARYLSSSQPSGEFDPLLVPIHAYHKTIGILALGERGDHEPYAGPDFEALDLIQTRYSSILENARLYAVRTRQTTMLAKFYSSVPESNTTPAEVARLYTRIASDASTAGAQFWRYKPETGALQCQERVGPEFLTGEEHLLPGEGSWSTCFYGTGDTQVPPGLSHVSGSSFAWLPLHGTPQPLGVLVLTYPRPHLFSPEEKRILSMFADQFAAALTNAIFTVQLRAAYARQKELDRLKDQFITTASHELRTPLSAVYGYIELLSTYNLTLSQEKRTEFLAKASRGCDELTLILGNIMDASRVHIDAEQLTLGQISLAQSVRHILEILEAVIRREGRNVTVAIPADITVMADDLRLRQVLLNLVSNAIKYSFERTTIDITCSRDDKNVTVRIRDYGLGVPPQDQPRLFGRFVRLERDMNSPIRGAGLGLYISKQLIEAMGGRIWVESTGHEGLGSTFTFTLKRAPEGVSDTPYQAMTSDK